MKKFKENIKILLIKNEFNKREGVLSGYIKLPRQRGALLLRTLAGKSGKKPEINQFLLV
jgi:hypothetical protein